MRNYFLKRKNILTILIMKPYLTEVKAKLNSEFKKNGRKRTHSITMVTKVAWRFPTQSLLHAEIHVGFHVKFMLLLSNFN
jgi:hypothetical protein